MKILFAAFDLLIAFCANAQWQQINTGFSNSYWDVVFTSENTGYICGDAGSIIKTTNGGLNWISVTPYTNTSYTSIYFINDNTGWVAGYYYLIYKTTNGGLNWTGYNATSGNGILEIQFVNEYTGYACGNTNIFIKSTDGGLNWVSLSPIVQSINSNIFFLNAETGYKVSYSPSNMVEWHSIARTTDGGFNWSSVFATGSEKIRDIFFTNEKFGFASAESNKIYYTSDYGSSWAYRNLTGQNWGLFFNDSLTGYVCTSSGSIYKTTNGGINFIQQVSTTSGGLKSIYFLNYYTGYCVGVLGKFLKTSNGGSTDIRTISTEVPFTVSLKQNYPNPFNPSTKIRFDLSQTENGKQKTVTKLVVYDIAGREVQTLVNESLQPGSYEVTFDGSGLNSGLYFYRLTVGNYNETRSMVFIK